MRHVQVCLCAVMTWESRFDSRGGAGKQVQACFSAAKDRESSFQHCGGTVMVTQVRCHETSGKVFSPLWRSCEACRSLFMVRYRRSKHRESTVKCVQSSLCAEMTWKRHFHHRGGAVKHVQACCSSHKDQESRFHLSGGTVKLEQAFLRAWKHLESSCHYCGCHMRLVKVILCAVMTWESRFDRRGGAGK